MGRKPKSRPTFFKVLIKDFTHHLQLPPVFVDKYGRFIAKKMKLRTKSGETWKVELEKMGHDDNYWFSRGWKEFAENVGVKLGEFLVLWLDIGNSTFDVSVFGVNGCERQISATDCTRVKPNSPEVIKNTKSGSSNEASESDGTQEPDDNISEEAHPHFKLLLKNHHNSKVPIPKDFAVAASLTSEEAAVIQYHSKQRSWPVMLYRFPKMSYFRIDLGKGWSEFRRTNGLVYGKTYLFEYIASKNVINVKLVD